MGTDYEDVCPIAFPAQEALNNQVDKMTYSVDVSKPLFPAIPVLVQWVQERQW